MVLGTGYELPFSWILFFLIPVDVNKKLEKQDVDDLAKQLEEERQQRKTTEDRLKRLLSRKRRG